MAIRYKEWSEYEKVFSTDLTKLANNGAVEVDTQAEMDALWTSHPDINVVYLVEDQYLYIRKDYGFEQIEAGPGAVRIELSGDGSGAATTDLKELNYSGSLYHVYTFMGNDTFTVLDPGVEVDLLVVSGGGGGAHQNGNHAAGNGGGGGTRRVLDVTLQPGLYTVTIGGGAGGWPNGNEGGRTTLVKDGATTLYNPRGGGGGGYTYNYGERTRGFDGGSGGGAGDGASPPGSGTPGEGQPGSGISGGGAGPTYGQGGQGSPLTLDGWRADALGNNVQFAVAKQNYRTNSRAPANTGWGGSSGVGHDQGGHAGGSGLFVMRRKIK